MSDGEDVIFMGWMSLPFAENLQEDNVATKHTEECIYSGQAEKCDGSCTKSKS